MRIFQKRGLKQKYAKLLSEAKKALEKAYCPYSDYRVGAALIASSGRIYKGANVENASYGLSCCAERTAVFSAVTAGEREIVMIAVAAEGNAAVAPCGACRQVIYEFGKDADVIMSVGGSIKTAKISKLLPGAFRSDMLSGKKRSLSMPACGMAPDSQKKV